jgi:uncharacterized integral membrane protein
VIVAHHMGEETWPLLVATGGSAVTVGLVMVRVRIGRVRELWRGRLRR